MSKKKKSKKLKKAAKARLAKMDKKLLSASDALLTISVEAGKKWHKLFKHSITVAEPIREKQIDMFFDTTDAVRDQLEEGAERFKKILGIKENIGDIVQKNISKNKVTKQLVENANKLVSVVGESGLKDSIEKGAVKIKMEITERLGGKKKNKSKKKSEKKKSSKKKSVAKKVKSAIAKKSKTSAKRKTTAGKSSTSNKPTAKRRGRPAGSTNTKKATAPKKATATGAKRGPKPGTKRKVSASAKSAASKTTAKRRGRPAGSTKAKKATTAKSRTTGAKRGRKPNPGKPGFDDLKKVMGIGAKMEKILNKEGIKTYRDLQRVGVRKLQGIINDAGGYYQSFKPQMWKAEAALAAAGKFDKMKSGRR